MGRNDSGQLGLNDRDERSDPTILLGIKGKSVVCGFYHTIIIDMDNNIWGMGNNEDGQIGKGGFLEMYKYVPTILPNTKGKFVACGSYHTMIIDMESNIWVMGNNEYGQLGLGDNDIRKTPTKIPNIKGNFISCGNNHTAIIDLDNNIWHKTLFNLGLWVIMNMDN